MRWWLGMALAGVAVWGAIAAASDDPAGPPGPLELTPADAAIYFEATLDPAAEQSRDLERAPARFPASLRDELAGTFERELARALPFGAGGDGIPPWVGDRIGGFVLGVDEGGAGALVVPVREVEPARALIAEAYAAAGASDRGRYRGIEYERAAGLGVAAVVDRAIVWAGAAPGLEAAIDARLGAADDLAGTDRAATIAELGDTPLATLLVDESALASASRLGGFGRLVGAAPRARPALATAPAPAAGPRLARAGPAGTGPPSGYAAAFFAEPGAMRVEARWIGGERSIEDTLLFGSLPGESLFAASIVGFGEDFATGFRKGIREQGEVEPRVYRGQIAAALGFDPVVTASAIGEVAVYVAPGGYSAYTAGMVADVENETIVVAALAGLRRLLDERTSARVTRLAVPAAPGTRGFSVYPEGWRPVDVALTGGSYARRLVITVAGDGIPEAVDPPRKLAASRRLARARRLLGSEAEPALILEGALVRGLLRIEPVSSAAREAVRYLRPLGTIAGGATPDGYRLVAELRSGR